MGFVASMIKNMILSAMMMSNITNVSLVDAQTISIGGSYDDHHCMIGAGYSWCAASNSCIRMWETPCEDYFDGCPDCLKKQRLGQNIACPRICDSLVDPTAVPIMVVDPMPPTPMHPVDPMYPMPPTPPPPMPCSDVMCMMYCENGFQQDDNGCPSCSCNSVRGFNHRCAVGFCEDQNDCPRCHDMNPLLTCTVQPEQMCAGTCYGRCEYTLDPVIDPVIDPVPNPSQDECVIPYSECNNLYACPRVEEVTECGLGGISGYTTYRLSVVLKSGMNIKNIFAMYGSTDQSNTPMYIPAAKQMSVPYGNNVGGVSEQIVLLNEESVYDSWLTIGITDGNINNDINTIGVPFDSWDEHNELVVNDGAVFLMNPEKTMDITTEVILGQLTIPTGSNERAILNIEGKLMYPANGLNSWTEENLVFHLNQQNIHTEGLIPKNCISWNDGCNDCSVRNGVLGACTRMMCFREDEPRCLSYGQTSGH